MNEIAIRSIQHYLYCPHRWGLIEIGDIWLENFYVTKGNIVHKNVHQPHIETIGSDRKRYTSVSVYNDLSQYNIYGVVDCLEISEHDEYSIIEYKPTQPKDKSFNYDDSMQVFAQKICIDFIFNTNSKAYIYYADKRKRVELPFDTEYYEYNVNLIKVITDMRKHISDGVIPPIVNGQYCSGCSFHDVCIPKLSISNPTREEVLKMIGDDDA